MDSITTRITGLKKLRTEETRKLDGELRMTGLSSETPMLSFVQPLVPPVNEEARRLFANCNIEKIVFYMSNGDSVTLW